MHNFKELKVWQKARELVKEIYRLTKDFPQEEKYGLISQIQRAAISISSNIAEGSGRSTKNDFKRFLDIACASAFEVENLIILSYDLKYINDLKFKQMSEKIQEIQKMIYSLKNKVSDNIK